MNIANHQNSKSKDMLRIATNVKVFDDRVLSFAKGAAIPVKKLHGEKQLNVEDLYKLTSTFH